VMSTSGCLLKWQPIIEYGIGASGVFPAMYCNFWQSYECYTII
jgi:hypothetical protein